MLAEDAYLFRHALLRDAAYQLQMPGERARLHLLVIEIVERLHGGRPGAMPALENADASDFVAHSIDSVASELAEHAALAADGDESSSAHALELQKLYTRRGAEYAARNEQSVEALRLWQSCASMHAGTAKGEALRRAAWAAQLAGKPQVAEPLLRDALALFQQGGARRLEGVVLGNLAKLFRETGRPAEAEQVLLVALAMPELSESREAGNVQFQLALTYEETGRVAPAEQLFRQVLEWARKRSDLRFEGMALGSLAGLCYETGRVDEAERLHADALSLFRQTGHRRSEGIELENLASLYQATGRSAQAQAAHELALKLACETGNRSAEGLAAGNHANLHMDAGRFDEAEQGYAKAQAIAIETGNTALAAHWLGNLAGLYDETGRHSLAEETYEQALAAHRRLRNRQMEGVVLGNFAVLHGKTGRHEHAEAMLAEAIAIHRETKNRRFEGVHECSWAKLLIAHDCERARVKWLLGAQILRELKDSGTLEIMARAMREACAKAGISPFDV